MKKLSNLLAALVFASLVIFISCGGDDGGGTPDPLTTQANLLQGSWTIDPASSTIVDGDWGSFTLTLSNATANGGNFSTAGVPAGFETVWPASGTWTFNDGDKDFIRRDDGVVMNVEDVDDSGLDLSFTITVSGASRTSGIGGAWRFVLTASN